MTKTQDPICKSGYAFFYGGWAGNFWESPIAHPEYPDKVFKSGEHYFQWYKAIYFHDLSSARAIYRAKDPYEAKSLGRKVKGFNDTLWWYVRYPAMFWIVYNKFRQNEDLSKKLINTPGSFVECSKNDKIWGIGFDLAEGIENIIIAKPHWGLNLLGRILDETKYALSPPMKIPF